MDPRTLLAALATAMLAGAALAEPVGDCGSDGQPAFGIVQVTGGTADSTFYVDDRNYALGNGIWMYAESNGLWTPKPPGVYDGDPGARDLQRGSHICEPWSGPLCAQEVCLDWDENYWTYGPDLLIL